MCKSLIMLGGNEMIQLAFKKELNNVKSMPQEVQESIKEIVEILNMELIEKDMKMLEVM